MYGEEDCDYSSPVIPRGNAKYSSSILEIILLSQQAISNFTGLIRMYLITVCNQSLVQHIGSSAAFAWVSHVNSVI